MKKRDFRISDNSRKVMDFFSPLFETDLQIQNYYRQAQNLAFIYNKKHKETISAGGLNATAILHFIYQIVISQHPDVKEAHLFEKISNLAIQNDSCSQVLSFYEKMFPTELPENNAKNCSDEVVRAFFVHQVFQANPAILKATADLLNQKDLVYPRGEKDLLLLLGKFLSNSKINGVKNNNNEDLFSFLTLPARLFPDSLSKQLEYIYKNWKMFLPEYLINLLLNALDYIAEETKMHGTGGPGEIQLPDYSNDESAESFTQDKSWMPNVVMMAKSTLVWLDQLSKKYGRDIHTLDKIPDEELDYLKDCGFSALWLIGLWERSPASKKIKTMCGNPDAESSAYSLKGYIISSKIGGWNALNNLRIRCNNRGIRLASDMVPNHTGLDSDLLLSHPEYFIRQDFPPFPSYSYTKDNLSDNPDYEIRIEDHYFNRTDAAVTFQMKNTRTGEIKYVFHGNDGTSMAWNDTAQLDYLNPKTREAVIQQILEVARNFSIIRFDAAMTLAKKHIQRLWYPKPGCGGDVAGRAGHSMSDYEFNRRIPTEFWREVVDRIQQEIPDTLLLAEAFWMMEGYFVRTLGMHRVYNSAFMHMMKNEDNKKYRDSIKATLAFDPEILKRYVNFMNNPDEETAIDQFGNGDKYFGICTMLSTMPGLPLFGHGQIEGFHEKYGMEYQRAYWNEIPDQNLIQRHKSLIFPLLKMRYLFSECQFFQFFDVIGKDGIVESVYAFVNGNEKQMTLVIYNNNYYHAEGIIYNSVPKRNKANQCLETVSLAESLRLTKSDRKYTIYRTFPDNLYHLKPSIKFYEDNFKVSIDGYKTLIYTEITEVEDNNSYYSQLYKNIGDSGVEDIKLEVSNLCLQPFFDMAFKLSEINVLKTIHKLLYARCSTKEKDVLLKTLCKYYTSIGNLSSVLANVDINAKCISNFEIENLLKRFSKTVRQKLFANGIRVLREKFTLYTALCFAVLPFVKKGDSLGQVFHNIRKLTIEKIFKDYINSSNDLMMGVFLAHLLLNSDNIEENNLNIDFLFENSVFLDLIGRNYYNNICWYNEEAFHNALFVFCFANAINTKIKAEDAEFLIKYWLNKSSKSEYKLNLLKK